MNPFNFGVVDDDTILYASSSYIMKVCFADEVAYEFPLSQQADSVRVLECSGKYALLSIDDRLFSICHGSASTHRGVRTNDFTMGVRVCQQKDIFVGFLSLGSGGCYFDHTSGELVTVDLSSYAHADVESTAVLTRLQGLFQYVRTSSGVLYGHCRMLDGTYVIICVQGSVVHRIVNHCGPTDICLWERTGLYLSLLNDKPVVRNNERVFVVDGTTSRAFLADGDFVSITGIYNDKLMYRKRGQWMFSSSLGPKRVSVRGSGGSTDLLAATSTRLVVRSPSMGLYVTRTESEDTVAAPQQPQQQPKRAVRCYVVMCAEKYNVKVYNVLESIRSRTNDIRVEEIAPHVCIVVTAVRIDSFKDSLRHAFAAAAADGLVFFNDFVMVEFPTHESAELFSRRMWC
jgi:hypothetical protein